MFGYIRPANNIKEEDLIDYKSFYCGFCKSMKKYKKPILRLTTNYDITFLNLFLHAISGIKTDVSKQNCILKPLEFKEISLEDPLTEKVIDFNNILLYYKLEDNLYDDKSKKDKFIKDNFEKFYKESRDRNRYLDNLVKNSNERIRELENKNIKDYKILADPFSDMLAKSTKYLLDDNINENIYSFMYYIGLFIYTIDAIKDIKQDYKKHRFNPFISSEIKDVDQFIKDNKEYFNKILIDIYNNIVSKYENINIKCYEGVITNIVWFGLLAVINQTLKGEKNG